MALPSRPRALAFLWDRSAATMAHRNGTLLDHLLATEARLRSWGSPEELCRAGLCHAAYGTDGFAPSLLSFHERAVVAEVAGAEVEEIVYHYAACDRALVYPQLPGSAPVAFADRFTATTLALSHAQLGAFADLTLANEVDVAGGGPEWPPWFGALVAQVEGRASPAARREVAALLRRAGGPSPVPATGSSGRWEEDREPGC